MANVYRNEKSGTLHGLLRVRGLSMDDAHIFCTMDQVEDEIFLCLDQVDRLVRATFGFELDFEVSTRPEERLGGDEVWDRAEAILKRALERKGIPYRIDEGGGAFYGPKIDIKFKRRDRPDLAGAHDPARLQPAGAVRAGVHRARTTGRTGR